MNFEGVVVLVTGASSDVGKTLCEILEKYGATVIGLYHKHKQKSNKIEYLSCDITKEKEVSKIVNYIQNKYYKLDVLINCAALALDDDIYNKSAKDFLDVLNVNVVGPFLTTKYASEIMDSGVIINISSTDGIDTYTPISMDYSSSKAALINLTKNIALRFPKLKVCALCPMWINTESVMEMDPKYLKEEMDKHNQYELLRKEDVALKIIEMIINNDDYITGDIVRMEKNYE